MQHVFRGIFVALAMFACVATIQADSNIVDDLQNISVTIKAGNSQGSGVLFSRQVNNEVRTYVWTAGHVVSGLRKTRNVIINGSPKTIVSFDDPGIVQEFRQDGRRIGETNMDTKIIRYSDADDGEDLALLEVRKKNFVDAATTVKFYLDATIPPIGTDLYHCGSLNGQIGNNSLTQGILSQTGRVLKLDKGTVFDQTTATAFPGSSGGGVYLKSDGRCIGLVLRGAGEGFNFIVPVRRLVAWAKSANIEWAVNPAISMPSDEELKKLPVEDAGVVFEKNDSNTKQPGAGIEEKYPKLIIKS